MTTKLSARSFELMVLVPIVIVAVAALSRPLALARATTFTSIVPVVGTAIAMVALSTSEDGVADANAGTTFTY